MAKSKLRLVSPTNVNRTVTPRRRPNAEVRTREHLTSREVERLIEAAKQNRHGHRDSTMVLLAYRHGLRASELCDLCLGIRWTSIAPSCTSVESSTPATHEAPAGIRGIPLRVCLGTCLDGCPNSLCSAISRAWPFPGSGTPHQLAMAKSKMQKDELIIQLLKIGLGLVFAAYFLWWSLEVLSRLPPH
jgi:hypothetical protein